MCKTSACGVWANASNVLCAREVHCVCDKKHMSSKIAPKTNEPALNVGYVSTQHSSQKFVP